VRCLAFAIPVTRQLSFAESGVHELTFLLLHDAVESEDPQPRSSREVFDRSLFMACGGAASDSTAVSFASVLRSRHSGLVGHTRFYNSTRTTFTPTTRLARARKVRAHVNQGVGEHSRLTSFISHGKLGGPKCLPHSCFLLMSRTIY
jgi:hypothetical protein